MMRTMLGRRLVVTALASVGLAAAVPTGAQARPWVANYDWTGTPATGFQNWGVENVLPDTGAAGPWYDTWLGDAPTAIGRGLGIRPTGGRVYDNGNPASQVGGPRSLFRWEAPGGSTVQAVTFDDVRYRNVDDDQYLRLAIYGSAPLQQALRDIGPEYGETRTSTYDLGPVPLTAATAGTRVEAWMFNVCHPDPPASDTTFACKDVPADTDTFAQVGKARITLDDPDLPTLQVGSQPEIGAGWVARRTTQRVTASATDGSSGIARLRVQVRIGASVRTLTDRAVDCDERLRATDRGGLVCPTTAAVDAVDPATSGGSTDRTYVVTAWDYAGNSTEQELTVRQDVTKPTDGSFGGELRGLAGRWTNRRGTVPVTLRAADARSGVGKVELLAVRETGGRATVIASATPTCATACTTVAEAVPANLDLLARDGVYRLSVQVTDRAGNSRSFASTPSLRIDRTSPRPGGPDPELEYRRDGSVRVTFPASRDPEPGSGLKVFLLRYSPKGTTPVGPTDGTRFARATLADTADAKVVPKRFGRSRARTFTFRPPGGVSRIQPVTLLSVDAAVGGVPQPDADGEPGNTSERAVRLADDDDATLDELRKLMDLDVLERRMKGAAVDLTKNVGNAKKFGDLLKKGVTGGGPLAKILKEVLKNFLDGEETGCASSKENDIAVAMRNASAAIGDALASSANWKDLKLWDKRSAAWDLGRTGPALKKIDAAAEAVAKVSDIANSAASEPIGKCNAKRRFAGAVVPELQAALLTADQHVSSNAKSAALRKVDAMFKRGQRATAFVCGPGGKGSNGKPTKFTKAYKSYVYRGAQSVRSRTLTLGTTTYVGRTVSFVRRCKSHQAAGRAQWVQSLKLPGLYPTEAGAVEEALIAFYGIAGERSTTHPDVKARLRGVETNVGLTSGSTVNKRHEIDRTKPGYCDALLLGQYSLARLGDKATAARFTASTRCPYDVNLI